MSAWQNDVAHRSGDTDFSQSKERTRELTGLSTNQVRGLSVVGWSCRHNWLTFKTVGGVFFSYFCDSGAETFLFRLIRVSTLIRLFLKPKPTAKIRYDFFFCTG